MKRRDFVGFSLAAMGLAFAPKFGRWHRQGSGLLVPDQHVELQLLVDGKVVETQVGRGHGEGWNQFTVPTTGFASFRARYVRRGYVAGPFNNSAQTFPVMTGDVATAYVGLE